MQPWDPAVFRDKVVMPGLVTIDLYSTARERLVLGTGMVESGLRATVQNGGGPALGFFQMEPRTHDDIWSNFLGRTNNLYLVDGLRKLSDRPGVADELAKNPQYAAAMCGIFYLRIPAPLPNENDLEGLAQYWKRYYNTELGAGTIGRFIEVAESFGLMSL